MEPCRKESTAFCGFLAIRYPFEIHSMLRMEPCRKESTAFGGTPYDIPYDIVYHTISPFSTIFCSDIIMPSFAWGYVSPP